MGRRLLIRRGGPGGGASAGFTLIETMVAAAIAIIVMLANLFLFSTASRNLAAARALTEATNVATGKIADFRSRTIPEIEALAPTVQAPPNPLGVRSGGDTMTAGGIAFTRSWVVSQVDLEGDGTPDMVGDLVKIRLVVSWTAGGAPHEVSMATTVVGRTP